MGALYVVVTLDCRVVRASLLYTLLRQDIKDARFTKIIVPILGCSAGRQHSRTNVNPIDHTKIIGSNILPEDLVEAVVKPTG